MRLRIPKTDSPKNTQMKRNVFCTSTPSASSTKLKMTLARGGHATRELWLLQPKLALDMLCFRFRWLVILLFWPGH